MLLRSLAEKITRDHLDQYTVNKEMHRIALYMTNKGYLCSYHARIDPDVDPSKCRICLELFESF
ncbi:MAG: hypothetical protein DRO12_05375 [Thermoprotei archaeon]|nr:MAG: hypothetical protein DRO12_05375 [Thermoprotei archaeon]